MSQKIIILDHVRSAHNVGSVFRTGDGAGVSKVYLVGYTPAPIDRFGRPQKEITKTSLGASGVIPWEQVPGEDIKNKILSLKEEGFTVVAVEQDKASVNFYDFNKPEKVCYVFGNEVDGVSREVLDLADVILEIPMQGMKESLNVSVTAGIVLFK